MDEIEIFTVKTEAVENEFLEENEIVEDIENLSDERPETKFICGIVESETHRPCRKEFPLEEEKTNHQNQDHPRHRFKCPICCKRFTLKKYTQVAFQLVRIIFLPILKTNGDDNPSLT
jgi:hypothetical protein